MVAASSGLGLGCKTVLAGFRPERRFSSSLGWGTVPPETLVPSKPCLFPVFPAVPISLETQPCRCELASVHFCPPSLLVLLLAF